MTVTMTTSGRVGRPRSLGLALVGIALMLAGGDLAVRGAEPGRGDAWAAATRRSG